MAIEYSTLIGSSLTLNGTEIVEYSDAEDGISFPDRELTAHKTGATGKKNVGFTGERGGQVTIKLLSNSKSIPFFKGIDNATVLGSLIKLEGFLQYSNGSTCTMTNGTLVKCPAGQTLGRGVSKDHEAIIHFETIIHEALTGVY